MKDFLHMRKLLAQKSREEGNSIGNRCSGRTLSHALMNIASAITNPNLPLELKDHSETEEGHKHLMNEVQNIITRLELEGFYLDWRYRILTFKPGWEE